MLVAGAGIGSDAGAGAELLAQDGSRHSVCSSSQLSGSSVVAREQPRARMVATKSLPCCSKPATGDDAEITYCACRGRQQPRYAHTSHIKYDVYDSVIDACQYQS